MRIYYICKSVCIRTYMYVQHPNIIDELRAINSERHAFSPAVKCLAADYGHKLVH